MTAPAHSALNATTPATTTLDTATLEQAWLAVAEGISAVGEKHESVFLAKLVLLLLDDRNVTGLPQLVEQAKKDL
jgi:hypothetical protein